MPNERSFVREALRSVSCLPHLLEHQARRIPDAPAILAPGRAPLTYDRLFQHIEEMERRLRAMGIRRHDRIAVVLPNGPEMAVAILTVAASAACAPLNPAYGADELDGYFADLHPRALITLAGIDSPARAWRSRGASVSSSCRPPPTRRPVFSRSPETKRCASDQPAAPATSRCCSHVGHDGAAEHRPADARRYVHIGLRHGAALALTRNRSMLECPALVSRAWFPCHLDCLAGGGRERRVYPGLDVKRFSAWLTAFQPTWYSAVPTMHQAIRPRSAQSRATGDSRLRFVRSSSASLPPQHLRGTRAGFRGSAHRVLWDDGSHFLADRVQSAAAAPAQGGFGRGAGRSGCRDHGRTWELCCPAADGPGCRPGCKRYPGLLRQSEATQAAFAGDWFKTGDLGFFDDDGYLFLAGRIREMINRGGEKVAPQEVDEVLLDHRRWRRP